jgi:HD superfamily phosphohydrolase
MNKVYYTHSLYSQNISRRYKNKFIISRYIFTAKFTAVAHDSSHAIFSRVLKSYIRYHVNMSTQKYAFTIEKIFERNTNAFKSHMIIRIRIFTWN